MVYPWSFRICVATLFNLIYASLVAAAPKNCPDPFIDPKNDFCNPLRYIPSNALTAIAFVLFLLVALAQSWLTYKYGAKYMLAMTIGCYTFVMGFGARFGVPSSPHSLGVFIAQNTLILLSPCAFIAAEYVLLGRLVRWLGCDKHLIINPTRVTLIFVSSDIITFLIQGSGGGIMASASGDKTKSDLGSHIFLIGLIIQLISFIAFMTICFVFLVRVYKYEEHIWSINSDKPWYNDWRTLAGALFVSSIGILVRSIYRTVELSEGFGGPLSRTESLFYLLDTLPLFVAISVYIPFWPGRFISSSPITQSYSSYSLPERQRKYPFVAVTQANGSQERL